MSAEPQDDNPYRSTLPVRYKRGYHPNTIATRNKPWEPGKVINPGGAPKGTPRTDLAYKKILAMSPAERAVFEPANGAEEMALEAFNRALVQDLKFNVLPYTQEITNRTDGPLVRKIEKSDITALEAERTKFELAVSALVERRGCGREEAVLVLVTVVPHFAKFAPADGE